MNTGIMLHNLSQISIPFFVIAVVLNYFPNVDMQTLVLIAFAGAYLPDIDHFSMWKTVPHRGFFDFVKIVMRAERYRRAFLVFHNHLTMLIVAVAIPIFYVTNFFATVFLTAFLIHLMLDYLADVLLIKMHSHWKFRNWF